MTETKAHSPEYGTVQLIIDHLVVDAKAQRDEMVQKFVFSTETPDAALLSLVKYYGMTEILLDPSSLEILREAPTHPDAAYVLVTPGGIQVVVAYDTWERMAFDPGFGDKSYLNSTMKLLDLLAKRMDALRGKLPSLLLVAFTAEEPEAAQPQAKLYTQAEVDALLAEAAAE